ncbi:MAG: S9 family peptidase [Pseudomonadota bacterium]
MPIPRTPLNLASLLFCTALLGACSTAPTHPSLRSTDSNTMTPLVPARQYVANWDGNGAYQISPDGQQLMWAARKGLGQGLFIKNLQTGVVHSYRLPPGQWAQDSRHVLLHLENGNENFQVAQLDSFAEDMRLTLLTPFAGSRSTIQTQIQGSNDLLIASNKRDAKVFDLYRYSHTSGALTLVAQNPGNVAHWITDRVGQVVGRARKEGEQRVYETPLDASNTQWRAAFQVSLHDTLQVLEVTADHQSLWALSNRGRDKLALVKVNLGDGSEQVVHADPRVDVSQAHISTKTLEPRAVALDPGYQEWTFFDPRLRAAAEKLIGPDPARLEIGNISRDENVLVATVTRQDSGQYVLLDLAQQQVTVLGEATRSHIHAHGPLPQQQPVAFTSRDGLAIHGYLTLPIRGSGKQLPTVVYVHGGPWERDVALQGDPMPLFLANRGYAVLQVNYRGSRGYGRAFLEASKGEFAGKMHTDLLDGVDHLVGQGITDPNAVAIMGTSYGGYASLVGMAFTPGRFRCGISMVGMSDLASLTANAPAYWELNQGRWLQYVGDPSKPNERAVMDAKSPLFRAADVQGPLLILHGARDPRVPLDQATRMVDALRAQGKPVELQVYKNAGHGPHRWPDKLDYFRKTEDFLAQCLGGRSSGFDLLQLGSWAL